MLKQISIEQIVRGKYQPRRHFDPKQLEELAHSIKKTGGLLQPILVRPLKDNQYEIIAGERRWRACQLAGLNEISCLVKHYTNEEALQAAIIENINRADLNPIEEAEAYQRLIDEFHYVHEDIAAAVGKNRTTITNALRLLKLDNRVQALLISGELSEGHGKILAGVPLNQQYGFAELCIQKNWTVRKIEQEIKKRGNTHPIDHPYTDPNLKRLETTLSDHIGNAVQLNYEDQGGGYVKIRFNNIDELEGFFEKLKFNPEK